MTDLTLNILLTAQDGASSVLNSVGSVVTNLASGNVLGAVATAAVGVGAAIAAIGAQSVQMAAQYQQSMNMVQALTGSSNQQMQQYDAGLKQLATDAGVAPNQLASGLYNILSSGESGAQAMRTLTLATEDSKIGMVDATTAANALTSMINNFNVSAADTTRVNGEVLQTVTMGGTTFQQYASTITKAANTSVQYGQSMETMNAAFATLTSNRISAAQAVTDYDQSLKVMDGNIGTVTKSLQKNGIAFDEAKFNSMSYGDQVVYLNTALQKANAEHVKITGVTIQAAQAIQTISQHIKTYNSDLATLENKQAMEQKTAQAWAITQQGFSQKLSQLGAALQVSMINIGNVLLPVLGNVVSWVTQVVNNFNNWETRTHGLENAIKTLGVWINNIRTFLAPLGPVIMNVINWLGQTGSAIGNNKSLWASLWSTLQQVWQFLVTTFTPVWQQLVTTFNTQLKPAWADFMTQIGPSLPFLKQLAQVIGGILIADFIYWTSVIAGTLGALAGFFSGLIRAIGGIVEFISGAIQFLIGTFTFFQDLMTGNWNKLGSDWSVIWGGIVRMFQGAWDVMAGISEAGVNMIIGFINAFASAATAMLNPILQAAHMAPIAIGKIPTLHMSTTPGGAASFVPYQATTTTSASKSTSPLLTGSPQIQQMIAQAQQQTALLQQQAAAMKQQSAGQQQQQQQLSQIYANTPTPTTGAVNSAAATGTANSIKQQQAAQVAAMRLADTQQKALANSSSSQVQALVNASKQAQAQGNMALASYDAQKAATLASQQKSAAQHAAKQAASQQKHAAAQAAAAAKKAASAAKHQQTLAAAAARHKATLAAHAAKLAQSGKHHKVLIDTILQSTNQLLSNQCPQTSILPTALGVALPDYATGTGYVQAAPTPITQAAPQGSGGTVHHHYNISIHTDSKDPKEHGRAAADEVKKHMAKQLRGQSIAPRYTSGGTHK